MECLKGTANIFRVTGLNVNLILTCAIIVFLNAWLLPDQNEP